ncbi:MAG TPA: hypothetical protein GX696_09240, partial [Pseudomonadaceae bacterium]|nr:hypothetical protein [Pseudomonadaceae bacterium]
SIYLQPAPARAQGDDYDRLIFDPVPLTEATDGQQGGLASDATGVADDAADGEASPSTAAADLRSFDQLQRAIDQAMVEEGLYSPLLRERYLDLARLQQRIGQHTEALQSLDAAMHITRVNEGLFTATQISDLEQMLDSAQALGDLEKEAELRAYLYYVQRKVFEPGDPRLAIAMVEWADWNMLRYQQGINARPHSVVLPGGAREEELLVLRNSRTGDVRFIPRRHMMTLGSAGAFFDSPYSLMPEMVIDSRLQTARDIYEELFDALVKAEAGEEMGLAVRRLAAAEYTLKWQMDQMLGSNAPNFNSVGRRADAYRDMPMIQRGYRSAREAWRDYIRKLRDAPDTSTETLIQAWIDLGDYHLAFGEESAAREAWASAALAMREAGLDDEAIHTRLNPHPPVQVPAFVVHPYQRALFGIAPDDTLAYQGYIDVDMAIYRDGSTRSVDIINASEGTPQRIRTKLLEHLRAQVFRPLVEEEELAGISDVQTRYYYSY